MTEYILVSGAPGKFIPVLKENTGCEGFFRYIILRNIYKKKLTKSLVYKFHIIHAGKLIGVDVKHIGYPGLHQDPIIELDYFNDDDEFLDSLYITCDIKIVRRYTIES